MGIELSFKVHKKGNLTANGEEQTLTEVTTLSRVSGYVDLTNMIQGDTVIIREYLDLLGEGYGKYAEETYTNAQTIPIIYVESKEAEKVKVTLEQTVGEYKHFNNVFIREVDIVQTSRWRVINNQMIFYDEDGETPLYTFNLFDKDGNPAMEKVFERRLV